MSRILVAGTLPATILENSSRQNWQGLLQLSGDLASLRGIDLSGIGASYFSVSLDLRLGLAWVAPAARIDFEAFAVLGLVPVLDFQMVMQFGDGSTETEPTRFSITVLNLDDTPPSALAFSSGGTIAAGKLGAVIGTLRVTDVDSSGPFTFTFADSDAWKYQVVGNTLMLAPGYSFGLDDVGLMKLPVTVSDGTQSAGFLLPIVVSAPGSQPDLIKYLNPGDYTYKFYYNSATSITTMRVSSDVGFIENYGAGVHALMLRDGTALWLPGTVTQIHFADGWVDLRPTGPAMQVYSLYHTLLHRDPDPLGYDSWTQQLTTGATTLLAATSAFMASAEYASRIGRLDDAAFVTQLYWDALGRAPDPNGYANQLARLQSGVSRAQMVDSFIMSPEAQNLLRKQHADGFWVAEPYGKEVAMVYNVALGRVPDPIGLDSWIHKLVDGSLTPAQLARKFGASQEFLGGYANLSNADFVTAMYWNALHRAPDTKGFTNWTAKLDAGILTRPDMVNAFAFSPESYSYYNKHFGGLDLFFY